MCPLDPMVTAENAANDTASLMRSLGRSGRAAARLIAQAEPERKSAGLRASAAIMRASEAPILAANEVDVVKAGRAGRSAAFIDRLKLTPSRIEAMAEGIEMVAALSDPVGSVMAAWTRPNGLAIERVRVPLGVIGMIFESRPNVTADAGALCLKSGNAVILRPGSESLSSAQAIHACLDTGLREAGLPAEAIQLVPTGDRETVGLMLAGLDGCIDVIVPRGGKSLVGRVQNEARVPVFAHLEGICHVYVDSKADIEMAKRIVVNAKMRRTGVCGAAECLLIDRAATDRLVKPLMASLIDAGCEVRGDAICQAADARVKPASDEDWGREFLDAVIAAKIVEGVDGAIAHIARYGSQHTDSIVTQDKEVAECFLREVDSAIVLHNTSTQFADGAEFGMGAEIGIATGRFHARGPVGVEQLTTFKYVVRGNGQIRPS
jgi:glutamate-5-semialdehyde dehydrogenase